MTAGHIKTELTVSETQRKLSLCLFFMEIDSYVQTIHISIFHIYKRN